MPSYFRAFHLQDLRKYSAWAMERTDLSDDTVVFLRADFSVVMSPAADAPLLFAGSDVRWKEFCTHQLQFRVPEWEAEVNDSA